MSYGILLTRAQPIHKGHMKTLLHILEEHDRALLVIGSANKCMTRRNPLTLEQRLFFVRIALRDAGIANRVDILTLCDWSQEDAYQYAKEWGRFLYYNIVNLIQQKTLTLYYNDDPEIVENWFPPELRNRVTIKTAPRIAGVSSTEVRQAILSGDTAYLREVMAPSRFADNASVMHFLKKALEESDRQDFIMK